MSLDHYLKIWNLSDPQPLATTFSSHVYTVTSEGARVVLKLLTPAGFEEKSGASALRYFDGQAAVQLLREADGAYLLEYANGDDLTGYVKRGEDTRATEIIADVLNQLHTQPNSPLPDDLPPLNIWFRSLFARAKTDSRFAHAARLAGTLLSDPHDIRVLHGDIHHENIRFKDGRGWLAFDPKGLIGERTYDAANTLCNPVGMPELVENEERLLKNAGILAQKLGIELNRILAFTYAYTGLSASWSLEDGNDQDASHALRVAELVEPHVQ